jgi:hypothetical protein
MASQLIERPMAPDGSSKNTKTETIGNVEKNAVYAIGVVSARSRHWLTEYVMNRETAAARRPSSRQAVGR